MHLETRQLTPLMLLLKVRIQVAEVNQDGVKIIPLINNGVNNGLFFFSRLKCRISYTLFCVFTDTEPPVFTSTPGNITANNDPDLPTAVISWVAPTATDNSGVVSLTSNYQPGNRFPIGNTNVTYIAVDNAGNDVVYSFDVTIIGR